jgi:hypothetical protein
MISDLDRPPFGEASPTAEAVAMTTIVATASALGVDVVWAETELI